MALFLIFYFYAMVKNGSQNVVILKKCSQNVVSFKTKKQKDDQ